MEEGGYWSWSEIQGTGWSVRGRKGMRNIGKGRPGKCQEAADRKNYLSDDWGGRSRRREVGGEV